ncbi:hypothetical protein ALI22I_08895 [Saccharothrix sp. ALI-22-I]|nr:hypothetical protein ALI22I_08895 [Saccharothrix sp. ALI-22-I]
MTCQTRAIVRCASPPSAVAQAALPDHSLARLMRQALIAGYPPQALRSFCEEALDAGRESSQHTDT